MIYKRQSYLNNQDILQIKIWKKKNQIMVELYEWE